MNVTSDARIGRLTAELVEENDPDSKESADPVLGILRSKGLMRDNDGTPKSFQQVGSRTQACNLAYPDPDCGRLVCIGLRASLDEAAIGLRLQAALLQA